MTTRVLTTSAPILLVVSSALYFACSGEVDNDFWWHLLTGLVILTDWALPVTDSLSFTAVGAGWTNHEWLTDLVLAFLYVHTGTWGIYSLKVLLGLVLFALLGLLVRGKAQFNLPSLLLLVLLIASSARGVGTRPGLVTYVLLALLMVGLERKLFGRRTWLIIPFLCVLWGNSHGGFVAGFGVLGTYAAMAVLCGDRSGWSVGFGLTLGILALGFLNPFGFELYRYILEELKAPHELTEWQTPLLTPAEHVPFFTLLGIFLGTLPWGLKKERLWCVLLALGTAYLALKHRRHTTVFCVVSASQIGFQIKILLNAKANDFYSQCSHSARVALSSGFLFIAALQLFFSIQLGVLGLHYRTQDYPVEFSRPMSLSGTMVLPLEWGGFMLWHQSPCVRVSIDGRFATLYDPSIFLDNRRILEGTRGWEEVVHQWNPDFVLVKQGGGRHLESSSSFTLAARGREWELFRTTQKEQSFLDLSSVDEVGQAVSTPFPSARVACQQGENPY